MKKQKGSILLPLVIIILLASAGGFWFINNKKISDSNLEVKNENAKVDVKAEPEAQVKDEEVVKNDLPVETPKVTQTVKVETVPVVVPINKPETVATTNSTSEYVKYVAKYREMVSVISKQNVDLFLDYSKNNADQLLTRGLITKTEYDEFMKESDSVSNEEVQFLLGLMIAFGLGNYDPSLPSDKFIDKNEVVTLEKDGNNVKITVEAIDSKNNGTQTLSFNFVIDPKDGTVFPSLDF